jgi:hypothetical protein
MTCTAVLLRVGHRRARQLRWTGPLLIVLALSSLGCARGDWTTETLTLVDVTGTWEGVFKLSAQTRGIERTTRWVLQQKGGKVRGEVQALDGPSRASIEGQVNGEVFSWRLTGSFVQLPSGSASSQSFRGEATITLDEMSSQADGPGCPCTVRLRRAAQ